MLESMTRRHAVRLLPMLGAFALAACSQLPETPPPADAVGAPASLFSLSPGTQPDGTLRVTLRRGQATSQGILETNGERLRVTVTGLAAQGAARVDAVAQVYGLPQGGTNFPGTYRIVADDASGTGLLTGGLRLGNDNLVLIVLQPRREGTVFTVPAEGMTATLGR